MKAYWILLIMISSFLAGCSSLLYYPTNNLHYHPKQFKLEPDDIWFNSLDGTKLNGWYFKHKNKDKHTKAIFMFFHGNGENMSSHYISLLWLLEHDYDFFIFDYQGYGRSEGEPSPQGTVEDGLAAMELIHKKYPQMPMVVLGQSLGGAVAMKTVLESKGKYPVKLVVAESTFSSYKDVAKGALASHWGTWIFQPFALLTLSDSHAPGEDIKDISPIPIIVIHGDADKTVEIKHGRKVFELAAEPKEFWEVKGGQHTDAFVGATREIYQKRLLEKLSSILK